MLTPPLSHCVVQTEIVINLRYPLMGGWKTDFVLGKATNRDHRLRIDYSNQLTAMIVAHGALGVGATHLCVLGLPVLPSSMSHNALSLTLAELGDKFYSSPTSGIRR